MGNCKERKSRVERGYDVPEAKGAGGDMRMYGLRYGESREYSGGAELWILLYFPLATLSKWTSRQGTIITINRPATSQGPIWAN